MGTVSPLPPREGVSAAVRSAIAAMTWLGPADRGLVALALTYAAKIDDATDDKTLGWVGPHLTGVLRSLGGAPAERKALGLDEPLRGKLAELRARRQ